MPCNCDHLKPTEYEKELKLVSILMKHVSDNIPKNIPKIIVESNSPERATKMLLDRSTEWLCSTILEMNVSELNRIVYDGRDPMARKLADWWDKHKELDQKRIQNELIEKKKQKALKKLTSEEKELLGLD